MKTTASLIRAASPWGGIDHHTPIAYGLDWVSTPSHGGIKLGPARWAEFRAAFPGFRGYASDGWLEEDLDWSAAAVLWPEHFEPRVVFHAVEGVLNYESGGRHYFGTGRDWLLGAAGQPARDKAQQFRP